LVESGKLIILQIFWGEKKKVHSSKPGLFFLFSKNTFSYFLKNNLVFVFFLLQKKLFFVKYFFDFFQKIIIL